MASIENIFDKIFHLILDKQTKLSSKAAIIFLIVLIVLLLNNIFNFSSSYVLNNNISQIKELNLIIGDTISDLETKNYAKELREKIIHDKNIIELTYEYFNDINWQNITKHQNHPESRGATVKFGFSNARLTFWQHLSAGGFFYLLSFISLFFGFFPKSTSVIEKLSNSILTSFYLFLIGFLCTMIMTLIPVISNSFIFINYIINLIIQFFILYGITKINS